MIEKLKRLNWIMFFAMAVLIAIGTVAIWSAGGARSEVVFHGMWKANLSTALFGLVIYFVLAFIDYRKLLDYTALPAYGLAVVLLVAVLVFGSTVYGGKRWLWFFQPSEISKLCIIAFLAQIFGRPPPEEELPAPRRNWLRRVFAGSSRFAFAALLIGLPLVLILAEPDLGTALTLVPATALMLFVAKVWRRGIVALLAVAGVGATVVLGAVYEAEKPGTSPERRDAILRFVPLKPHQVKRVKVFLFPEEDLTGAGYNLRQAKISIGSGGFSGKGIGKGESHRLKYLPPSISMNDFIFCVYAEETGFVGSLVLLVLFGLLLLPAVWVAFMATDGRGRLLALGIVTLVFAHVYTNIAMSIGLVPITGLPLPFISAGRTFLVTVIASFGMIQSVAIHGKEKE